MEDLRQGGYPDWSRKRTGPAPSTKLLINYRGLVISVLSSFNHQTSPLHFLRFSSIPAKWPPTPLPPPPAPARSMPRRLSSRPLTLPLPLALTCTRDSLSPVPSAAPSPTEPSHPSMCTLSRSVMALRGLNGCIAQVLRQLTDVKNDDRMPS